MQALWLAPPKLGLKVPSGHCVGATAPCGQKWACGHCEAQVALVWAVGAVELP